MEFNFASFCISRSFVRYHICGFNWIKTIAIALGFLVLPCCKQKSASEQQSSKSTDTQAFAVKINPAIPCRPPTDVITPAQSAFWDYIEAFHRLPDQPTDLQRRIFATRGEAKPFQIISTSPTSVLADVAGIEAHGERFSLRYPWVKKLLEEENISLDVDESLFQGSANEIVSKHEKKVNSSSRNYLKAEPDRRLFTKRWLESLLVIDFIFAYGSTQDRKAGMDLLEQTITLAAYTGADSLQRAKRGAELEIPVVFEIAMPIVNEFRDEASKKLVNYLPHLIIGEENADSYIDCLKWTLRVQAFSKWENLVDGNQIEVGNQCVDHGLLHEAIYWHHLQKNVQPDPGSTGQAVRALFDVIYGKKAGATEHQKYSDLLKAAYPLAQ